MTWQGRWWGRGDERARYREWIELELQGRLPASVRTRLHDHLRVNPEARAEYDRGIAAFRLLEGREDGVADCELDMVESWLFDGRVAEEPAPVTAGTARRGWGWGLRGGLALCGAAAAAALLFVWPNGQIEGQREVAPGELTARGHGALRGLELGALCIAADEAGALASRSRPRPAAQAPCSLDDALGFEYRVRAQGELATGPRALSLFGVDEDGRVQYYAPTPVDAAAVPAIVGRAVAAPISVQLSVNHQPGRVQIFALLSPVTPTVNQIDRWASSLQGVVASTDDEPWHRRLTPTQLSAVCPQPDDCESAEVTLHLLDEVDR
ncbi:MAG: hypothetical protein H6713_29620 [Myxococcales bacterium]|nr:hypothetical protein [Myxococcales bacterium]